MHIGTIENNLGYVAGIRHKFSLDDVNVVISMLITFILWFSVQLVRGASQDKYMGWTIELWLCECSTNLYWTHS